jgi:hypothetical protein
MISQSLNQAATGSEARGRVLTTADLEALVEHLPPAVFTADGQLTQYDRLLYYWSARAHFRGEGTIVDGGALVGGTTRMFTAGLKENPRVESARDTVFVYDLFTDARDGYSAKLIKSWYQDESNRDPVYDFERHFRRNVGVDLPMTRIHKGDITTFPYTDPRPIEVLSIDVAKSADLMHHCARAFFPHLIPGHSIILHQDYIFAFQPWLLIAMELLADRIEKVYDVPTFCTAAFMPREELTERYVRERLGENGAGFYHLGNARYIHQAIEKAETHLGRVILTAALSYFYHVMGRRETARFVARGLIDQFDVSPGLIERIGLKQLYVGELGMTV